MTYEWDWMTPEDEAIAFRLGRAAFLAGLHERTLRRDALRMRAAMKRRTVANLCALLERAAVALEWYAAEVNGDVNDATAEEIRRVLGPLRYKDEEQS